MQVRNTQSRRESRLISLSYDSWFELERASSKLAVSVDDILQLLVQAASGNTSVRETLVQLSSQSIDTTNGNRSN